MNTLVNFESALLSLDGQFSVGGNNAIFSHVTMLGNSDWFVVACLKVNGSKAVLTLEDGNGTIRAKQKITYTDFPMADQVLYVCWDGQHWVLMLPSEY